LACYIFVNKVLLFWQVLLPLQSAYWNFAETLKLEISFPIDKHRGWTEKTVQCFRYNNNAFSMLCIASSILFRVYASPLIIEGIKEMIKPG
jgi:hypothetical protein